MGSSTIKSHMTSAARGMEGKVIKIATSKCGTGPDNRYIEVPVLWSFDEDGNQMMGWDWNSSTGYLLKRILENKDAKYGFYAERLKKLLHLDWTGNKWTCPELSLDKATAADVGVELCKPENGELLREIEKCFGVMRYTYFQDYEFEE